MGTDRFVYWNKRKPKREEVQRVIHDYFGDLLAEDAQWDKHSASRGRFNIKLRGNRSNPLNRIDGAYKMPTEMPGADNGRYIEVFVDPKYVDVITRMADDATSTLAEGLAVVFARFWEGRREEED